MIKIEELHQASDNALHGLTADDSLKFRILQKAAGADTQKEKRIFRPVPVLCSLIALLVVAVVALSTLQPVSPSANPGEMNVFAAGIKETDEPFSALAPEAVSSVELAGIGAVTDPEQCAALISLLQEAALPEESDNATEGIELLITDADGTRHKYVLEEKDYPSFFSLFRQSLEK